MPEFKPKPRPLQPAAGGAGAGGGSRPSGPPSDSNPAASQAPILEAFWSLSSLEKQARLTGASSLIRQLAQAQADFEQQQATSGAASAAAPCNDIAYTLRRLVRGLASSRAGARQGFALALTELLQSFPCVGVDMVMSELARVSFATQQASRQEQRDALLATVFGALVLCRSGRLSGGPEHGALRARLVSSLLGAASSKEWVADIAFEGVAALVATSDARVWREHLAPVVEPALAGSLRRWTPGQLDLALAVEEAMGRWGAAGGAGDLAAPAFLTSLLAALSPQYLARYHLTESLTGAGAQALLPPLPSAAHARRSGPLSVTGGDPAVRAAEEARQRALAAAEAAEEAAAEASTLPRDAPLSPALHASSSSFPGLHSVWTRLLQRFFASGGLDPASRDFAEAWRVYVDELLLPSGHERKATAMVLLSKVLAALAARADAGDAPAAAAGLSAVLSQHLVRAITRAIGNKKRLMHEPALAAVAALTAACKGRPALASAAVICLLARGHANFDAVTGTRTIAGLLTELDDESVGGFLAAAQREFAAPEAAPVYADLASTATGLSAARVHAGLAPPPGKGEGAPVAGRPRDSASEDGEGGEEGGEGEEAGGEAQADEQGEASAAAARKRLFSAIDLRRLWAVDALASALRNGSLAVLQRPGAAGKILAFLFLHASAEIILPDGALRLLADRAAAAEAAAAGAGGAAGGKKGKAAAAAAAAALPALSPSLEALLQLLRHTGLLPPPPSEQDRAPGPQQLQRAAAAAREELVAVRLAVADPPISPLLRTELRARLPALIRELATATTAPPAAAPGAAPAAAAAPECQQPTSDRTAGASLKWGSYAGAAGLVWDAAAATSAACAAAAEEDADAVEMAVFPPVAALALRGSGEDDEDDGDEEEEEEEEGDSEASEGGDTVFEVRERACGAAGLLRQCGVTLLAAAGAWTGGADTHTAPGEAAPALPPDAAVAAAARTGLLPAAALDMARRCGALSALLSHTALLLLGEAAAVAEAVAAAAPGGGARGAAQGATGGHAHHPHDGPCDHDHSDDSSSEEEEGEEGEGGAGAKGASAQESQSALARQREEALGATTEALADLVVAAGRLCAPAAEAVGALLQQQQGPAPGAKGAPKQKQQQQAAAHPLASVAADLALLSAPPADEDEEEGEGGAAPDAVLVFTDAALALLSNADGSLREAVKAAARTVYGPSSPSACLDAILAVVAATGDEEEEDDEEEEGAKRPSSGKRERSADDAAEGEGEEDDDASITLDGGAVLGVLLGKRGDGATAANGDDDEGDEDEEEEEDAEEGQSSAAAEEEMRRYESMLGSMLRIRRAERTAQRTAKKQALHFKFRALDLLDIAVGRMGSGPGPSSSAAAAAASTGAEGDEGQLQALQHAPLALIRVMRALALRARRAPAPAAPAAAASAPAARPATETAADAAAALLHRLRGVLARVLKGRLPLASSPPAAQALLRGLEECVAMAGEAPSPAFGEACASVAGALLRMLRAPPPPGPPAASPGAGQAQAQPALAHLPRIAAAFGAALEARLGGRGEVPPAFFRALSTNSPTVSVHLLPRLGSLLERGGVRKRFMAAEALGLALTVVKACSAPWAAGLPAAAPATTAAVAGEGKKKKKEAVAVAASGGAPRSVHEVLLGEATAPLLRALAACLGAVVVAAAATPGGKSPSGKGAIVAPAAPAPGAQAQQALSPKQLKEPLALLALLLRLHASSPTAAAPERSAAADAAMLAVRGLLAAPGCASQPGVKAACAAVLRSAGGAAEQTGAEAGEEPAPAAAVGSGAPPEAGAPAAAPADGQLKKKRKRDRAQGQAAAAGGDEPAAGEQSEAVAGAPPAAAAADAVAAGAEEGQHPPEGSNQKSKKQQKKARREAGKGAE